MKFDLVGGDIRPEKIPMFEKTIIECRKICPELIASLHRLNIGDAQRFATTFLWEGLESYTDVLIRNRNCAPHHRECGLCRGLVPDMLRLTEDHGVCLSSCLDYFEDELVVQAFSRALDFLPRYTELPRCCVTMSSRVLRVYTILPQNTENSLSRASRSKTMMFAASAKTP